MNVSYRLGARALACVLGAALISAPCAPVFAQGKPDAAKADKAGKGDANGKGDASGKGKAAAKKGKPTKAERAKARAAFEKGEEKLKAGDFAAALEAYREADSVIPTAQAQYKIAFCLEKLGKSAEAAEAYRAFLEFPPPEKMAEQKGLAEARVAELSKGTIKLSSEPAGAKVKVDGEPASGPTPVTIAVKPGTHSVELVAPDHEPATRDVTVGAGATVEVNVPLTPTAPPAPPPAPPPPPPVASAPAPSPAPAPPAPPPSKVPAYVTLGLGGVGAVVGTVFGLKALSAKSDFKTQKTSDKADEVERNALIADMAFGVAITLGITGTVLLLSGESKPAEPAKAGQLRLAPIITPQTQGAAAMMRF